ncbi:MAG: hypothetical protein NC910_03085 [Candidatus Omnitrophica bacterium]|nr:hypothetical protein [Candidatus Omnitrophota bacterium]
MNNAKRTVFILAAIFGLSMPLVFGMMWWGQSLSGFRSSSPAPTGEKESVHFTKKSGKIQLPRPETLGRVLKPGEAAPPPDLPPYTQPDPGVSRKQLKKVQQPSPAEQPVFEQGSITPSREEVEEMKRQGIVAY